MKNNNLDSNVQAQHEPTPVYVNFPVVDPIVTYLLLASIAAVFMFELSMSPSELNAFEFDWSNISSAVYAGQFFRLFSSMFIHFGSSHFLLNGFALYIFGREVERVYGHIRFAIVYLLGGLAGSVASFLYFTDNPVRSGGASGAIFAIFSALAVYLYQNRKMYGEYARVRLVQLATFAVINIFFGVFMDVNIDNAAHVGGMMGGFALAWFLSPKHEMRDVHTDAPYIEDVNTTEQWLLMPIIFGVALMIIIFFAISTQ